MAIVKCPECDGNISTNATKCVHCGCDITYCSECNSVIVGKVNVCSNCGYVFNKSQTSTNSGHGVECKDLNDAIVKWRSEKILRSVLGYAILPYIIFAIGLVLWVIALILTFTYGGSASDVEKYRSTVDSVKTLFGIGIGTYIFFVLFNEFRDLWVYLNFAQWLVKNNIDVKEMLKKDLSQDFKSVTYDRKLDLIAGINVGVVSTLYHTNTELRMDYIKRILLKSVLLGFASVMLGAFLIDNSEVYITYKLFATENSQFSFEMIESLWCLIVGVIAIVADIVVNGRFFSNLEKEHPKTWVKQNLPDYYDIYMANSLDKAIDESMDEKTYKF